MKRAMAMLAGLGLLFVLAAGPVAAGNGPPQPAFYVDGVQYRTVGTPTDVSGTGAPADTYDALYMLGGDLLSVAAAAPGDTDYNGGRWMVFGVTWTAGTDPVQLLSEEQVLAYANMGLLTIGSTPVTQFV